LEVTGDDFRFLQRFLHERSGLFLADEKRYLAEARLGRVIRERGIRDLADLCKLLRRGGTSGLEQVVIEAMTTNETYFFRDRQPFEVLRTSVLPEIIRRKRDLRRVVIWSAAASTGQEPYSLAMLLDEFAGELKGWQVDILATDISEACIERGRAGVYSQFEVQRGLPIRHLISYFEKSGNSNWQISAAIRKMVSFRTLNLAHEFADVGRFDLIFCRNVFIYFDPATRQIVLDRLQRHLLPHGVLALGAAETLIGLKSSLVARRDAPGFYASAEASAMNERSVA
jgi:chemotaxis protein methyltransferase CheR